MKSIYETLEYIFMEALKCHDEIQLLTEILNKIDKSQDKERLLYSLMIERKHDEIKLLNKIDEYIREVKK